MFAAGPRSALGARAVGRGLDQGVGPAEEVLAHLRRIPISSPITRLGSCRAYCARRSRARAREAVEELARDRGADARLDAAMRFDVKARDTRPAARRGAAGRATG